MGNCRVKINPSKCDSNHTKCEATKFQITNLPTPLMTLIPWTKLGLVRWCRWWQPHRPPWAADAPSDLLLRFHPSQPDVPHGGRSIEQLVPQYQSACGNSGMHRGLPNCGVYWHRPTGYSADRGWPSGSGRDQCQTDCGCADRSCGGDERWWWWRGNTEAAAMGRGARMRWWR